MMRLPQGLMRPRRRPRLRLLLQTSLLIVLSGPIVLARSSQDLNHPSGSTATPTKGNSVATQDDPIAKALEQAINRLAVAEEKNRLLEEQLKAKDDRISAKDERIQNLTDRIELMRANRTDTNTIITGDARMLEACNQQLSKAEARIYKLENPSFLKRAFNTDGLFKFAVGYGAGRLSK